VEVDVGDELALQRRHPDPRAVLDRAREPLQLVAVMVGDENVGDPVDAERVELLEDGPAAEVDEDGVSAGAEDVDVAGVPEAGDPGRGVHRRSLCRSTGDVATFPLPGVTR
jgi:hypothetical protein